MVAQLAIRFKRKRKIKNKFAVRLGKLSRRKDYRKVFDVRLGIVPFFVELLCENFSSLRNRTHDKVSEQIGWERMRYQSPHHAP